MQTNITEQLLNTPQGKEANDILRSCVHCGFCTATCPTYQLLGDELDGPRGRIYLIKQMLEGHTVSRKTQLHLDRCLTCRSCETTCPSGVQYGRLIDIGRELVEKKVVRDPLSRFKRFALRNIIPFPKRFAALLAVASIARPVLPSHLKNHLPKKSQQAVHQMFTKINKSKRKMLLLEGCVQSVTTPQTNAAARHLLQKLGIKLLSAPSAGCCGAVSHHLSASNEGLNFIRNNIDAWWPYIETQNNEMEMEIEAIVITASGCGVQVKEYGHLLKTDNNYADKARRISELAKDISEIITNETIPVAKVNKSQIQKRKKISFHSPCTLQHGQNLSGVVETILQEVGFELGTVKNAHLCCGSAGTYSIMQPELSNKLLHNKLTSLQKESPDMIVTANIGCQMHLQSSANVPVQHWIELLDSVIE
jgi:glycolate oxidase iron-sulfur subunit